MHVVIVSQSISTSAVLCMEDLHHLPPQALAIFPLPLLHRPLRLEGIEIDIPFRNELSTISFFTHYPGKSLRVN